MQFTFNGSNISGKTSVGDYTFPTGEAVEVNDAETIRRLTGHPEFTATEASEKPKKRRQRMKAD